MPHKNSIRRKKHATGRVIRGGYKAKAVARPWKVRSVSYFVRYEGEAQNWKSFMKRYREVHVPILTRLPGIRRVVLHSPVEWHDRFRVKPDRFSFVAQLVFDSSEALNRALQSEARAAARADFREFPAFRGEVYHQATISEEVYGA